MRSKGEQIIKTEKEIEKMKKFLKTYALEIALVLFTLVVIAAGVALIIYALRTGETVDIDLADPANPASPLNPVNPLNPIHMMG